MKAFAIASILEFASRAVAAPAPPQVTAKAHLHARQTSPNTVGFSASGTWTEVSCTGSMTDASVPAETRWADAKVNDAWPQLIEGYHNQREGGQQLDFPRYVYNAFGYQEGANCGDIEDGVCKNTVLCKGPVAGSLIINSMVSLHNCISESKEALDKAKDNVVGFADGFTRTFMKIPPPDVGLEILKVILDVSVFALGAASAVFWNVFAQSIKMFAKATVRGAMKDISNAGIAFAFVASKDTMKAPKDAGSQTPKIVELLQNFYNAYYEIQSEYLKATINPKDEESEDHLASVFTDGMMISSLDLNTENRFDLLTAQLQQVLYGRLIPAAWSMSTNKQKPFILKIDRRYYKCGAPVSESGDMSLDYWMTDDTAKKSSWCDKDGNSWFLLNGNFAKKCTGRACEAQNNPKIFGLLDGGDHDTLDELDVKIEDIIKSSYGGFLKNGQKNGYQLPQDSAFIVDENLKVQDTDLAFEGMLLTPGFFNFTICLDIKEAIKTLTTGDASQPICAESPSLDHNSPSANDAGYAPGNCGIHVTQWQRNLADKNVNPLQDYQLQVVLKDAADLEIGRANKQVAKPNVGLTVDSKLPFDVVVSVGDGSSDKVDDNSPVCMWYGNQWWCEGDVNHMCNFGSYDGGKREGDCGFDCQDPTDSPPASAERPLPASMTAANGDPPASTASPSDAPAEPTPTQDAPPAYKTGWCGVHVRQYQRRTAANPSGDYLAEVTLYDGEQNNIAFLSQTTAKNGEAVPVKDSPLPKTFSVTFGENDEAPIWMAYGDEKWAWGDVPHQCNFGAFDSGTKDGDCGFTC